MKILQIGSVPPPYGGVATYCCETSKHLANLGHRVFLLTFTSKGEDKTPNEDNYEILFLRQYKLVRKLAEAILFAFRCFITFDLSVYRYTYWVINQRDPRVILEWFYDMSYVYKMSKVNKIEIVMGHHASGRGLMALLIGRILKIPSRVFLYGGAIFNEINDERKEKLIRGVLRSGDRFFTCAQNTTDRAVELSVSRDKIVTLGVGVDGSKYLLVNKKRPDLGKFTIGFVGYLSPHRGLKELLIAISRIKKQIPSISLIVVGPDPNNYWKELDDLCRELNIERLVKYVGSVSNEDYLKLLPNFNVATFLIQKRITASMLGALEAQAMGIPILTTGLGGVKEVVWDEKTGIICNRDIDSICEGILRVHDGYQRGIWDRNLIRAWALEFSWGNIAQKISSDIS